MGHEPSSFVLGPDGDEVYVKGRSWQKPYPRRAEQPLPRRNHRW